MGRPERLGDLLVTDGFAALGLDRARVTLRFPTWGTLVVAGEYQRVARWGVYVDGNLLCSTRTREQAERWERLLCEDQPVSVVAGRD